MYNSYSQYYGMKKRTYDALKEVGDFYNENDVDEYIIIRLAEYHRNIQFPSLKRVLLDAFPDLTILISYDHSEILVIKNNYDHLKKNKKTKKFF